MAIFEPDPGDPEGKCLHCGQLPHVHDPWPGCPDYLEDAPPHVDVARPSVSVVHCRSLPGSQPPFSLGKEGVNLLLDVTWPQPGSTELLARDLSSGQRGLPYPKERIAEVLKEEINLLRVIARPPAGDGKNPVPTPARPTRRKTPRQPQPAPPAWPGELPGPPRLRRQPRPSTALPP
jgi:hypothetical protein